MVILTRSAHDLPVTEVTVLRAEVSHQILRAHLALPALVEPVPVRNAEARVAGYFLQVSLEPEQEGPVPQREVGPFVTHVILWPMQAVFLAHL